MINPVTGWFEIAQYEDKRSISIENLVETMWMSRYPRPIETTYDQGNGFFGHDIIKPLIEMEYTITSKPSTSGNPMSNAVLEMIQQVLGNLVRTFNISTNTYVDRHDPQTGILAAAEFVLFSTTNRQKGYSPGQLIFCRYMVISIKNRVDWELICQQKQTQTNKDNTREKKLRTDYDYKVGDKVMLTNQTAYTYYMPYKGPFGHSAAV